MLQGVTRVLQCVAMCYKLLQGVTRCYSVLQCVIRCYKVLKCVTRCYKMLQGTRRCYKYKLKREGVAVKGQANKVTKSTSLQSCRVIYPVFSTVPSLTVSVRLSIVLLL